MIEQRAEAKQTSNVIHTLYDASDSSSVEDVYGLGGERQTAPLRSIVVRTDWTDWNGSKCVTCKLGGGASVNVQPLCTWCTSRARRLPLASDPLSPSCLYGRTTSTHISRANTIKAQTCVGRFHRPR